MFFKCSALFLRSQISLVKANIYFKKDVAKLLVCLESIEQL